jgi:hypothetical protein
VQKIDLQGKDSAWRQVGTIDANIPFQILAKGSVDFGGIGNDDGVTAGVTGNAFIRWCTDNWGTIEKAAEELAKIAAVAAAADDPNMDHTKWPWIKYIFDNGGTVNYDEGGFWVAITRNDQPPSQANQANLLCKPALYYWYHKLFEQNNNIAYNTKVWVWVREHDGGRDPFNPKPDYGDNSGHYTIALDPDTKLLSGAADNPSSPLKRKKPNTSL